MPTWLFELRTMVGKYNWRGGRSEKWNFFPPSPKRSGAGRRYSVIFQKGDIRLELQGNGIEGLGST